MLVIDTDHPDGPLVRRATTWCDVIAAKFAVDYCNHGHGRCLLDPPIWTYWIIGGHHRYSLGGLLWHLGNATLRRMDSLPIEQHRE